jgi:formylglycine-generating enzyme required for sulfatase activity
MGSPSDELGRQSYEAQYTVTISESYYIQTTEVTQGQWEAIMGENPSSFTNCGLNCPVENIVKGFSNKTQTVAGRIT